MYLNLVMYLFEGINFPNLEKKKKETTLLVSQTTLIFATFAPPCHLLKDWIIAYVRVIHAYPRKEKQGESTMFNCQEEKKNRFTSKGENFRRPKNSLSIPWQRARLCARATLVGLGIDARLCMQVCTCCAWVYTCAREIQASRPCTHPRPTKPICLLITGAHTCQFIRRQKTTRERACTWQWKSRKPPISCNQWALAAAVARQRRRRRRERRGLIQLYDVFFTPSLPISSLFLSSPSRWWLAIALSLPQPLRHRHLLQFLYTFLPPLSSPLLIVLSLSSQFAVHRFSQRNERVDAKHQSRLLSFRDVPDRLPFPLRSPRLSHFRLVVSLFVARSNRRTIEQPHGRNFAIPF